MMKGTTDPDKIQCYKEKIEMVRNQPEINIGMAKLSKTPIEQKPEPKQKTPTELLSVKEKKPEPTLHEMIQQHGKSEEKKEEVKSFGELLTGKEPEEEKKKVGRPSTITDEDAKKYLTKERFRI